MTTNDAMVAVMARGKGTHKLMPNTATHNGATIRATRSSANHCRSNKLRQGIAMIARHHHHHAAAAKSR